MTTLSRFAVANKRAVLLSSLMLSALGLFMIFQIPQDVFPDATFPRIAVLVDFGLAPLKQIEMEVVKPLEEAVMGVPGVRLVRASISRGSAEINIDFAWSEDMFKTFQLVQAKVSGVRNVLPPGAQIEVKRYTSSTYPVSGYGLTSDRLNMVELTDILAYSVRPQLASIPGVEQVEIMGASLREYWVNLDPKKLAATKLDYRQVAQAIQETNSVQFMGRLNEFNKLYLNVADNRFLNLEDLKNTVVATRYPAPVRLSDVADIECGARAVYQYCQ